MSILESPQLELTVEPTLAPPEQTRLKRVGSLLMMAARLAIAVVFCTRILTAILVVGWVARWMGRNIHRGWWRNSPARGHLSWRGYVAEQEPQLAVGLSPRWFVDERARALWNRTRRDGRPAGRIRKLGRLPRILLGSLGANLRMGLTVLLATLIITAPGSFLMLAGWQYGWDISFHKVYEQAFIGRITFLVGVFAFIPALMYLPMAIPHLTATGRVRDFFQIRLVRRVARQGRLGVTLYAGAVALLSAPVYVAWLRIYGITNEPAFAWLETATPEQVVAFREGYVWNMTYLLFPAYLAVHLLAAAVYRRALPAWVARDPQAEEELPPPLATTLQRLGLISSVTSKRRMFLVRAVMGTARRGSSLVLWWTQLTFWLLFLAQILVANFFHAHPFLIWFNPWLLGLPCARWFPSW